MNISTPTKKGETKSQAPLSKSDKREQWRQSFKSVAKEGGFFEEMGSEHKALFVEKSKTLVIAFENLDDARQDLSNRMPWAMDFLSSKGWSAIGVMAHGPTWFRDPKVWDFFDSLKADKFYDRFERVVFYGTSMGGYGASAFSSSCPGAHVVAVNPQATLNREITGGWEPRFKKVWKRDFSGRYAHGPDEVHSAKSVRIFYDPCIAEDAMHAALFHGPNVEKFRCRHMGHGMLGTWRAIGILSRVITGSIEGSLTPTEVYEQLRKRKTNPVFQKRMLEHLIANEKPWMVRQYCRAVLDACHPQKRPHFANAKHQAEAKLNL